MTTLETIAAFHGEEGGAGDATIGISVFTEIVRIIYIF